MHVVVIGGGLAGLGAAVALAKSRPSNVPTEITLIDPKDYFEVRWAAIRAFFDPAVRKDMQCDLSPILGKHQITHTQARVSALNKAALILNTGKLLRFDLCVVAVGAVCPTPAVDAQPAEASARRAQLAAQGELLAGRNALVVGGGALGCEVAGELQHEAKGRARVALVHAGDALCPEMRPAGRKLALRELTRAGVDVALNRRAEKRADGQWVPVPTGGGGGGDGGDAVEGEPLAADEIIPCTGYRAANSFMSKGDLAASLDDAGWIKVDEQFRVEGGDGKIFAFGDCTNRGQKTAVNIFTNISVVAANIKMTLESVANGKGADELKAVSLKSMKAPPNVTILTLGPNTGVADTPIGAFSSLLPAIKNRGFFISKAKSHVDGH